MLHTNAFTRSFILRSTATSIMLAVLTACGGGGDGGGGGFVGVGVIAPAPQPVVAPLTLVLTRVGPQAIEVDWSDDPHVTSFLVLRDGFALATVTTTSLIDNSVFINETYCYQVQGHDAAGQLVAASSSGCITVFP